MVESFISLISILFGILGANIGGFLLKKYSLGFTTNTVVGVFGSIFFIKSFGRLGFSPQIIVETKIINYSLLSLNLLVSFLGGFLALFLISRLNYFLSKNK